MGGIIRNGTLRNTNPFQSKSNSKKEPTRRPSVEGLLVIWSKIKFTAGIGSGGVPPGRQCRQAKTTSSGYERPPLTRERPRNVATKGAAS